MSTDLLLHRFSLQSFPRSYIHHHECSRCANESTLGLGRSPSWFMEVPKSRHLSSLELFQNLPALLFSHETKQDL